MRFDQLPKELFLKIGESCDASTLENFKFANSNTYAIYEKYFKYNNVTEIRFEKTDVQKMSFISERPDQMCSYGPYEADKPPSKKLRENIMKIRNVERLIIHGYAELEMFKPYDGAIFLKGFKGLRKIETLSLENCSITYTNNRFKQIIQHFNVENLEINGFERPFDAENIFMKDEIFNLIPGNLSVAYPRYSQAEFTDDHLQQLLANPKPNLCIGDINTRFTYPGLLRTIKAALMAKLTVNWNLGFFRLQDWMHMKGFKEHRENLIRFAKDRLDLEIKLELVQHKDGRSVRYVFTADELDSTFTFSCADSRLFVCYRNFLTGEVRESDQFF